MSNILISTPPTSLATGLLQLDGGVAISSTPVYVADQTNTDSKLALSTTSVNVNTLTGSALMNIKGTTSSGAIASLLVQNSGGTQLFRVDNDGTVTGFFGSFTNGLYIGTPGTAGRLSIKSGGSTSSTNAIFVQNSGASQLLLVRDDGNIGIGAVTTNPAYQVTQGRYGIPTYFICNTQLQDAGTVGQVVGNFQFGFSPSSTTASIGAIKCITDTTWYNGRLAFFTQSGDGTISLATEKMTLLANGNLMVNTTTDLGSKVGIKGSGSTSATTTMLIQNSSASTLFQINDAGLIGVGQAPDTGTLPARLKIAPSNGKLANIGYIAAAGLPATLNDGDIYVYGNDLWLHSSFANPSLKGILSSRMKLNGLQSDYFYSSSAAKDFNQFNSSAWATFGWGSLVHSGYSYGNTVLGYQPTSVGVDSRMYDGWLQSVNGNNAYDPCAQLYVDMKGSIFARGVGSGAETDWKKALTDNTNSTTTVGSQTNYPSSKFAIDSTTKGFLPPRMTTGEKLAILTPASGLMVYDTSLNQMSYFNGAVWVNI